MYTTKGSADDVVIPPFRKGAQAYQTHNADIYKRRVLGLNTAPTSWVESKRFTPPRSAGYVRADRRHVHQGSADIVLGRAEGPHPQARRESGRISRWARRHGGAIA